MTTSEVISKLNPMREYLAQRHGVRSLSLFGSVARNQATPSSDVDLLVDFDRSVGLFALYSLQNELEEALGCPVDLGTAESLKPALRETVRSESVNVLTLDR